MDNRSLSDDLSKNLSGSTEDETAPGADNAGEQKNLLVDSLKTIAGLSGGSLETAVSDFLNGGGELHETTRAAVTRGGGSAVSEVGSMLSKQFNLSPAVAKLVASLLVKLIPSHTADSLTGKAKPKRKPKTASSKETSSQKKPKKKTTSKTSKKETASKTKSKKKTTTSKPAAKKKTTSKTGKKGAKAKKKSTRSEALDVP